MTDRTKSKRETIDQGNLIAALERLPVIVRRQHSGRAKVKRGYMYFGTKGWPDLLVLFRGGLVFVESKAGDGELSADQERVHGELRAMGHTVIVARDWQTTVIAVAAEMRQKASAA